jgi:hypothetical protein
MVAKDKDTNLFYFSITWKERCFVVMTPGANPIKLFWA